MGGTANAKENSSSCDHTSTACAKTGTYTNNRMMSAIRCAAVAQRPAHPTYVSVVDAAPAAESSLNTTSYLLSAPNTLDSSWQGAPMRVFHIYDSRRRLRLSYSEGYEGVKIARHLLMYGK